ncbi:MAG TPA: hypothetical protein VHJ78_09515, partial [Actinomycetota bacterium]|nr:hypothetical protein [Actinomycetota bacterium]
MRAETLEHLSCPAPGCAGGLFLSAAVKPWWSAPDKAELLEAVLRCEVCGSEYPVLLGVAVLETDLGSYLAAFWDEIESCEAGLEVSGVSPDMRAWLGAPGTMLGRRGPVLDGPASSDWSTAPYLQSHYDRESLPGGLPDGWWRQAV